MKKIVLYMFTSWMLGFSSFSAATVIEDYSKTIDVFKFSPLVQEYFEKSYGYAVYPNVGKGAWLVGFAYGSGQVYRRGYVTGTSKLYHLSFGLQAGGQVFSEIIFFQDQRAYEEFIRGTLSLTLKRRQLQSRPVPLPRAVPPGCRPQSAPARTRHSNTVPATLKGLRYSSSLKGACSLKRRSGDSE